MAQTSLHKYTTPDGSQQPIVHVDMKKLADEIDEDTYVECPSSTRPPHAPGRRIFETDTKRSYISDGTIWNQINTGMIFGHMGKTNGFQTSGGSFITVTMDAAQELRGGMLFDNAADALIVPVAGLYSINMRGYATGNSQQQAAFQVFSLTRNASLGGDLNYWKGSNLDFTASGSFTRALTANEKICIKANYSNSVWGTDGYNGVFLELEYKGE